MTDFVFESIRRRSGRRQARPDNIAQAFDSILARGQARGYQPGQNQKAIDWYRKTAARTVKDSIKYRGLNEPSAEYKNTVVPGFMYLFEYSPIHKETLPYWDKYPLVIPFSITSNYFTGINLHYLPPYLRAQLMNALYDLVVDEQLDSDTQITISYKILKSAVKFRAFKPCIKKYHEGHVTSRFLKISANQWDMALMMPLQKFQKKSKNVVWRDSTNMIQKEK